MREFNHDSSMNQNRIAKIICLLSALVGGSASASAEQLSASEILPVEEAFRFDYYETDEGVKVFWQITPGYYLYRDKFEFSVSDSGFSIASVDLPAGVTKDDPEFGPVPVYFGQVEIPVRFNRPAGPETTVALTAAM